MSGEFIQIDSFKSESTIFYSVHLDGKKVSEFEEFQCAMLQSDPKGLSEINLFIKKISERAGGAESRFFKKQNDADRLYLPTPIEYDIHKKDPKDYGPRLYCTWLSSKTVVLLNGSRKRYRRAQECPNCGAHFESANAISRAIHEALHFHEFEIDNEGYILTEPAYKLNII